MTLGLAGSAQAATSPIDLESATGYAVLAGSTITNSGPTVVTGDVGLNPGSQITGFEGAPSGGFVPGSGTARTDPGVGIAKRSLTKAYNAAASQTPQLPSLAELAGQNLGPGVYSGGALNLAAGGLLTLTGGAESVWIFQASSSLVTGVGSQIQVLGGASVCNVYWQVASSATLGGGSTFVGTVMAQQDISAGNAANVQGRLLASTGAVTLLNDTITAPLGCPKITSDAPTSATAGTPYSYTVTASGTPTPTFTVSSGALPTGLTLDSTTGVISGTPTTPGSSTFTITATNSIDSDSETYTVVTGSPTPTSPTDSGTPGTPGSPGTPGGGVPSGGTGNGNSLAATGLDASGLAAGAAALLAVGLVMTLRLTRRRTS
ncbi:ice-binding family protein [Agreia sp. COWG]|uniref:ice-binding family protein n=1 Tax=Agreia sp. COWG TaxID=2773266 RepID=UPI001F305A18|nr:ice-binding family protein [Agreia sp. COWG]